MANSGQTGEMTVRRLYVAGRTFSVKGIDECVTRES